MPIRGSPNGARHPRPQAGRDRPEWVVAINRNAWSQSIGIAGRNHPVRAFDLAIYTAPPGRSRAIDRYARSAQLPPGSDEARMLEAMRAARFAILIIGPRHDATGVIATDLFRRTRVWLVDIGLEASLKEGVMMATRKHSPRTADSVKHNS